MNITDLLDFTAERLGEDYNRAYGMQPSPWKITYDSDQPGQGSVVSDSSGYVMARGRYAPDPAEQQPDPAPSPADQVAAAAESIAKAAIGLATAVEQFTAAWSEKR